jgi:hypothetical protein
LEPGRAALVFRIKIAWNQGRTSFAIVSVAPNSGGGGLYTAPAAAPQEPAPQAPPDFGGWDSDPWSYGDQDDAADAPFYLFFPAFSFIPYYDAYRHHGPPSSTNHRSHNNGPLSSHRPPAWETGSRHPPTGPFANESGFRQKPHDDSTSHAQDRGAIDTGPRDHPQHHSPSSEHDRPRPSQDSPARARTAPSIDRQMAPDRLSRPVSSTPRPTPENPPQHDLTPRSRPAPVRDLAPAPHSSVAHERGSAPAPQISPPANREPAPSPRYTPSPVRDPSPPPAHSSPPPASSSSKSNDDSSSSRSGRQR